MKGQPRSITGCQQPSPLLSQCAYHAGLREAKGESYCTQLVIEIRSFCREATINCTAATAAV